MCLSSAIVRAVELQGVVTGTTMVTEIAAGAEAMLAASVFHFGELSIADVKQELAARGLEIRP